MAGDYLYVNAFDDVNGWDLQHARRVRWCRLPAQHSFTGSAFGANAPRCSRVWTQRLSTSHEVPQLAADILADGAAARASRRGATLDDVPVALQDIVAKAADLVPLSMHATIFWRASKRGRACRAFHCSIPARAWLAAGTDRYQVAAYRRGGVPCAAAYA